MNVFAEPIAYLSFFSSYAKQRLGRWFFRFESRKDSLVGSLIRERGRFVRPFVHSGVIGLVFLAVTLGPAILSERAQGRDTGSGGPEPVSLVLGASTSADFGSGIVDTQISDKPRSDVIDYSVQPGDTVAKIANKFDISEDTIYWENGLTPTSKIMPSKTIRILPVTGVRHAVARGETLASIAKKYDVSPQAIADWPFNTFVNDETFELAVGQTLVVPDGVKPNEVQVNPRQFIARQTPDAGTVVASGEWVWPTQGRITQPFVWYHKGIDIANRDLPAVVAADAGRVVAVITSNVGYGKHIIIDHGNGFQTLYAHLSAFRVEQGQTVSKGAVIGIMGSTGRSTGPHAHFEIRKNGAAVNPLEYLK